MKINSGRILNKKRETKAASCTNRASGNSEKKDEQVLPPIKPRISRRKQFAGLPQTCSLILT